MLHRVNSLVDRIAWFAEKIVIITFGIMVLAVLASVFTRNISIPVTWLEELSRYMQIWFVAIGFALALRKGMLAGTEVIIKLLPESISNRLIIVCKLLMLVICLLLLNSSTPLINHLINTGQKSPNMLIPIVWVYGGIYFSFILAAVFLVASLYSNFHGQRDELDKTFLLDAVHSLDPHKQEREK